MSRGLSILSESPLLRASNSHKPCGMFSHVFLVSWSCISWPFSVRVLSWELDLTSVSATLSVSSVWKDILCICAAALGQLWPLIVLCLELASEQWLYFTTY